MSNYKGASNLFALADQVNALLDRTSEKATRIEVDRLGDCVLYAQITSAGIGRVEVTFDLTGPTGPRRLGSCGTASALRALQQYAGRKF